MEENSSYLTGQLLIAMPGMPDPRFAKTVIYLCAHNADGAMGLVINKALENVTFPDLLEQLGIDVPTSEERIKVHFGGPVEADRGFVLHSADYAQDATLMVDDHVALTATIDILKAIAGGHGPHNSLLVLGYAGWSPGQLDQEIKQNGWLHVEADDMLLFDNDLASKWDQAMGKLGIDPSLLSDTTGHA
jgi:putative transcriptional regulator